VRFADRPIQKNRFVMPAYQSRDRDRHQLGCRRCWLPCSDDVGAF
jgi:hypothetical protein